MPLCKRKPVLLWALGAVIAVRLVMMAVLPMIDTSEPRYAEIARVMAQTGDWITPWFEPGVPFWGKPPLTFWASALSFQLFGGSDFAARLPVLITSLATMGLIYALMHERGMARAGKLAVLIYASCSLPFIAAGAVLTDAYLALAVTLSLVAAYQLLQKPCLKWYFGFWAGLALGMLAKGPLAVVLVFAVLLPWALWHRMTGELIRRLIGFSGPVLFLVLSIPWFVLAEMKTPGFLKYFFVGEHFYRFVDPGWKGDLYGTAHRRVYGSIWLDWILATMPWGPLALGLSLRWVLRWFRLGGKLAPSLSRIRLQQDRLLTLLVLWALVTPGFFTFSSNILWTYVLPSLLAFAMLLGWALVNREGWIGRDRVLAGTAMVVPAILVVGMTVMLAQPDRLKTEKSLVAYYEQSARAKEPLYYLDSRPFSARYYSEGRAGLVSADKAGLQALLTKYPGGVYLAIPKGKNGSLDGVQAGTVLFENGRYSLFYVTRGS